jgi:hypothetical protein
LTDDSESTLEGGRAGVLGVYARASFLWYVPSPPPVLFLHFSGLSDPMGKEKERAININVTIRSGFVPSSQFGKITCAPYNFISLHLEGAIGARHNSPEFARPGVACTPGALAGNYSTLIELQ